ncbi:MAG: hypothetical protein A2017_20245 [Lentisphaerae bacterium GWF2_44_16]|nr:MAG: hypothetical protein A2017_20245 [Lentisphaerae bacterium GWF2_44_16]
MADGKKSSGKTYVFGCGCLFFLLLLLAAFIMGAMYGRELVDKTTERINTISEAIHKAFGDASEDAEKGVEKIDAEIEKTINQVK